jgi:hypothetical protein
MPKLTSKRLLTLWKEFFQHKSNSDGDLAVLFREIMDKLGDAHEILYDMEKDDAADNE